MTEVEWTPKALDLLDGLEPDTQERLVAKLDEAKDWTSHRLEKLSGYPYYKLRAGDYRSCKAKTPPFRAGIQPTTPPLATFDGTAGYSTYSRWF
jgi:hypothetical protein